MVWVWLLLGIIYILSPYDLLPDFMPVRGWIDDIVVLFFLVRYLLRLKRGPSTAEQAQDGSDGRQQSPRQNRGPARERPPHEVLGVAPDAGPVEIRAAYRRLAGQYHPDKVAHLGKEFQEMAEKRFKEIQHAYDRLAK